MTCMTSYWKLRYINLKVKVTFNCKLQEKIGEQDVLLAPRIILLGEQRFPRL